MAMKQSQPAVLQIIHPEMDKSTNMLRKGITAWLPLVILPVVAFAFRFHLPAWGFMWMEAMAVFLGCKWLTWRRAKSHVPFFWQGAAYIFAWIGMDAERFLAGDV